MLYSLRTVKLSDSFVCLEIGTHGHRHGVPQICLPSQDSKHPSNEVNEPNENHFTCCFVCLFTIAAWQSALHQKESIARCYVGRASSYQQCTTCTHFLSKNDYNYMCVYIECEILPYHWHDLIVRFPLQYEPFVQLSWFHPKIYWLALQKVHN